MAKSPNRLLDLASDGHLFRNFTASENRRTEVWRSARRSRQPYSAVYFPYSGVISLVVELDVGDMIETAMVGRDGALNAASALDGKVSLNKGIVQLAGSCGHHRGQPAAPTGQ